MSGSAPIGKDTGSIGILYICAAINILLDNHKQGESDE